jgi:phosphatidylglycerophosphate synthase
MRRASAALGRVADLLTIVRLAVAPALVATLAAGWLAAAGALLAGSWITDALDGPAARASERRTHLGRFDLVVDTAVGAGALAGLALAGEVPARLAGALLFALGIGFLVLRNPALSMTLQAVGYAWLLWMLWDENEPAVWLPIGTAAGLLLLLHRRLFRAVVPAFVGGIATLPRRRKRFELLE